MSDYNNFNQKIIEEFRANAGKVGGQFMGAPMLLLTTTGAKSGQLRTSPLVYTTDGNHIIVIASKGGAPTNPAWLHNLLANSIVTAERSTKQFEARATVP
jgi:deazaflavin-dependent oxidoreductase (nitroreductase family)